MCGGRTREKEEDREGERNRRNEHRFAQSTAKSIIRIALIQSRVQKIVDCYYMQSIVLYVSQTVIVFFCSI